jgi:hypothetical protein
MSIRAMISFDVMKNERLYHILIPNGSPFVEAREVLLDIIDNLEEQEKADKAKSAEPEVQAEVSA